MCVPRFSGGRYRDGALVTSAREGQGRAVLAASSRFAASRSDAISLSTTQVLIDTNRRPRDAGNVVVGLRNSKAKAITGVTYRPAPAEDGMGIGREWPSSAQHQGVAVERRIPGGGTQAEADTRGYARAFTMDSAKVLITRATGSRAGHASRPAADPIAVHGSVPAGRTVARRRRLASDVRDQVAMGRSLRPGRYRVAFLISRVRRCQQFGVPVR